MVWRQIIPLLLLTVLHGEHCAGVLGTRCSEETCRCGENVTITCTLSNPLREITLQHHHKPLFHIDLLQEKKEGKIEDNKLSIEWTEDKVKVTILKVMFSDALEYILWMDAHTSIGYDPEHIRIKVFGICEPEITENSETKELECTAESEEPASIVWMDGHRKLYQATRTEEPEELTTGFRLRSSLKLTEEIGDTKICCSVSIDGRYTQESCTTIAPVFDPKCSKETCQCGENVTITCTPTHPLEEITLTYHSKPLLSSDLLKKVESIENKKYSIEWREDKVKVTISNVTFSDAMKYNLRMVPKGAKGYYNEPIKINVSGICEPTITKNHETNELECTAESEEPASIVWMDDHRKLYKATRTEKPEELNGGYKSRSSLKLTGEIGSTIYCSVSYPIDGGYTQKESSLPITLARDGAKDVEPPRDDNRNLTLPIFLTLLAVALVAAAFGYLLKRRSRIIIREAPEEQNTEEPPLVPPKTV